MSGVQKLEVLSGIGGIPDGTYDVVRRFVEAWPVVGKAGQTVSYTLLMVKIRQAADCADDAKQVDYAFYLPSDKEIGESFTLVKGIPFLA